MMPLWWIALGVYLVWVSFLCAKAVAKGLKHGMEPPPVVLPPPVVQPMSISDRLEISRARRQQENDAAWAEMQRIQAQWQLWKEIEDLTR